jgi:hypothetical protein
MFVTIRPLRRISIRCPLTYHQEILKASDYLERSHRTLCSVRATYLRDSMRNCFRTEEGNGVSLKRMSCSPACGKED